MYITYFYVKYHTNEYLEDCFKNGLRNILLGAIYYVGFIYSTLYNSTYFINNLNTK